MNHFNYSDNLAVLRDSIASKSVDLIYLDPPFNSKRDYNLFFKSPKDHAGEAQIEPFKDTWPWNQQAEPQFDEGSISIVLSPINEHIAIYAANA